MKKQKIVFLWLRLVMAFIFLWAFVDKTFGLGFATKKINAWINGGSPTYGFLIHTDGIFSSFFKSLAELPFVDWLFMIGLFFIGLTLLFNKYIFWGAIAGIAMMILMWFAIFPSANNPLVDEHIVYILVFVLLALKARSKNIDFL